MQRKYAWGESTECEENFAIDAYSGKRNIVVASIGTKVN